ncbi:mycothiol synthase [Trujillonella endophytica]|uniref:Mycothiol acetyltransferase n=1 Tax=Trujillonella endophytica TaxID=673521 RepID=A0A1H8RF91_9ACTN|nr:mycothiol synthase [Trujillella endophytica]SEO64804.1 mycothiol synthase [Trujillella endophytica]
MPTPPRPRPPTGPPLPSAEAALTVDPFAVRDVPRLEAAQVEAVLALLRAATAADGVRPLSEDAELRLQHGGGAGGRDVLVEIGDAVVGYARFEGGDPGDTDDTDDAEGELVVHPDARRRGVGRVLLARLEELAGHRPLRVWAHGDLPGSAELAAAGGYDRARVLLQMRRDLAGVDPDPRPSLPDGVRVLPFVPGRDEQAWLGVNARAFAAHPEQGGWTAADLALREAEPWFDAAGFLLAWRGDPGADGELLGSHWTKVHPPGDAGDEAIGEVYVLGIAPSAQGTGLGRALTDLGLAHLRGRGLREVLLYVEADNVPAVTLYEKRGFTRFSVDVSWRRAH